MQVTRFGIFILLSLFSISSFGQANENFIPNVFNKSPTSASFTKYGDYPTNLSSGLPDISIPLYTIESGGLKVPITLSYHASGIKVEQSATWVGLGWTLSSGGTISRNVIGLADDGPNGFFKYYQRATSLFPTNETDLRYLYNTVVNKTYDNRPDIYSYNIPGNSGKFFFNALNGTPITGYKIEMIPWSPVLIKNTAVRPDLDTAKFSILDEHGNSYVMGNKYREETHTSSTSSRPSEDATTSWMLERMVSQNKHDTISFTYRKQSLQLPDQTGQSYPVEDMSNDPNGPIYINNNWTAFTSNTQTKVSEQDPKEIFFKTGKVVFKISSIARTDLSGTLTYPLDTIQIFAYDFNRRQYESRPQKSIVFKRSYFAVMSGTQGRLKLDGIQVLDKAGSIVQEYKFTYNTTPLPTYNSFSKDFWGYYNGKMDATGITPYTLIPKTKISVQPSTFVPPNNVPYDRYIGSNDSTSRDPDTVKMQAGILTRIDYPTGGYTNFNYETNRYLDDSAITRFTGGLRLKSIQNYTSATATPILKTYKYNTAYPNFITNPITGYLNYGFFVNSTLAIDYYAEPLSRSKRVRMYYSESSSSLTPTEGNPVTYTSVTEYTGDATTNIGKSDYSYQFNADTYSGASGYTGNPVILERYFKRGQLLRKADYIRKTDGTYQIAKEEVNDYGAFLGGRDTMYNDVGLIVGQRWQSYTSGSPFLYFNAVNGGDRYALPFAAYNIVSGDSYPTATTTKIYNQNDPTKFQSSTVEYKYDNFKHQQVSRIRSIDSKGNTKVTVSKYPADYLIGAATSTNSIVLDSMLRNNMQAEIVEKWDSVKNISTGVNAVMGGRLNLYTNNSSGIFPYKISKLSVSSPITDFTPASVVSGSLITDSRYVQMISFDSYSNGNLVQYTPRNAPPINIIWDYNNAFPIAQITNASPIFGYRNSAYTSFEADNKGNWEYSGTPTTDPRAPTGKLVYPLNMGLIKMQVADLDRPHIISYWSDNGVASVSINGFGYPGLLIKTVRGYSLYKHAIPVISGHPTINLSGVANIDELKTYPADAQMTTYTYDTNGITQMTDAKDQVTTYEYDEAQRLKNIKDWQGNIVKSNGYHNYNMTIGNDAIPATTFTRNNCPPNTVPGSTTYSVAANTFYSSIKASANALAQYNLNANGQDKANDPAICGCPVQMLTFTVSNSTGISTYQATFTGNGTIYMPINATGNTTQQIPAGTYTLQISVVGTQIKNFKLGNRSVVNGRTATFNNVIIAPGSTDLNLSIY
jgi:YD repeat-containing protein